VKTIEVGQVWRERTTKFERYVLVIEVSLEELPILIEQRVRTRTCTMHGVVSKKPGASGRMRVVDFRRRFEFVSDPR